MTPACLDLSRLSRARLAPASRLFALVFVVVSAFDRQAVLELADPAKRDVPALGPQAGGRPAVLGRRRADRVRVEARLAVGGGAGRGLRARRRARRGRQARLRAASDQFTTS
ncbi:MAG: hypothetical protein R3B49_08900 [Phycisphaerales bacterium]